MLSVLTLTLILQIAIVYVCLRSGAMSAPSECSVFVGGITSFSDNVASWNGGEDYCKADSLSVLFQSSNTTKTLGVL